MKKILLLFTCLGLCLGLVACGGGEDASKNDDKKEETKKPEYAIGETAEVEGIKVTVNATRVDEGIIGTSDEGAIYFVMDITLENTTDEEFKSSSMMCYTLKDGEGREQDLTIGAKLNGSLDTEIGSGEKGTGEIAFKTAPEGKLVLTFKPGAFSDEKLKFIVR